MRHPFSNIHGRARRRSMWLGLGAVVLLSLAWRQHAEETPRAWAARDAPVAFWAWRNDAPAAAEVEGAAREANARTLFLRAGQFDLADGKLARIREVKGALPRIPTLHLVYHATRGLLAEFERVDERALASVIAETFRQDLQRAATDGAQVAGLQLDFDVPTRLLPRYARVLRGVRGGLPPRTQLSITGLPTWMQSAMLTQTLDATDFWIPQCYGATIPVRLEDATPISAPEQVALCVAGARRAGHPFYAGLAAYGYAILYDARGALIELRGDLDPASVARDPNFELLERRPFPADGKSAGQTTATTMTAQFEPATWRSTTTTSALRPDSPADPREWRYVYRALGDGLINNLAVRAGDQLLLDVPSAETLRATARAAREQGGAPLLGLCVFRLPSASDPTTLTLSQISDALRDAPAAVSTDVRIERDPQTSAGHLRIEAVNDGQAGALFGDDALMLTMRMPAGSVRGVVSMENITAVESLCSVIGLTPHDETRRGERLNEQSRAQLRPCSLRRADTLRLRASVWQAGALARVVLDLNDDEQLPVQLPLSVAVRADDGRTCRAERRISISESTQQQPRRANSDREPHFASSASAPRAARLKDGDASQP